MPSWFFLLQVIIHELFRAYIDIVEHIIAALFAIVCW